MPKLNRGWRRLAVAMALAIGATCLAGLLGRVGFVTTLNWKLYDQHVRWAADPARARRDIVLVTIDEASIRRLEPLVGRWPWPRLVHAALVDFLSRAPARVVAYDVLFTERDRRSGFAVGDTTWSGEESDREFAAAIARSGRVVLLGDATFEGTSTSEAVADHPTGAVKASEPSNAMTPAASPFESRPDLLPPYERLADAAQLIGHNYLVLDADGPVRRVVPFVSQAAHIVPSLGVAAFMAAEGIDGSAVTVAGGELRIGARHVPALREELPHFSAARGPAVFGERVLVDFAGPAVLADGHSTVYKQYSFYDLFYSEQQLQAGVAPFVDPAAFRNALVFVGVTAAGLHDVFATPFGSSGKMPGSQIHAAVADQLLSNRALRPVSDATTLFVALMASALVAAMFTWARMTTAALMFPLVLGAEVGAAVWFFGGGVWLPLGVPLIASAVAGVSGLSYQYIVEGREKRAVKQLFSRYLSPDVYAQVIANPVLAELGGGRREMSVLFSDIRGFTAVAERGEPEQLVAQLNEYFSSMVDVVFANRGTLDKFVGDMVMALFGAPLEDDDHADHAVQTALSMVDELDRLNVTWARDGKPSLAIGIGVNSGEMIAGNIGSHRIRSYTVIGDNVNLGARLESLNKDFGTSIIISEYTATRLKGRYVLRPLGDVVVKGKSVAVRIFEVKRPGSPELTDSAEIAT